ncbi:hypothetical protein [Desulfobacula sp.]|uniref:hypothetical protein n=1 Tax=Desulfobacula sp. TaxID=2593537 RepID=UPI002631DAB3|nr:hypothetical protein [Desulfobacula sp.]
MDKKYYAHSLEGKPPSEWQLLEEHLKNVAEMARLFANAFCVGDWRYLVWFQHGLGREINGFLC